MPRGIRAKSERIRAHALLLRRIAIGEADWMLTLFTDRLGVIGAVARAARRSTKRFAALEPMHLLAVTLDERPGAEVATLVEAAIAKPRMRLVGDLERLEAAGVALRWVRRGLAPHTPEPDVWRELDALLDGLDADAREGSPGRALAAMGLRLLGAIGYGLDFTQCVRCGRPCDPGASAFVDPAAGGLVCRACGGARTILRAERRERLAAAAGGSDEVLDDADAAVAVELVEAALTAHARGA